MSTAPLHPNHLKFSIKTWWNKKKDHCWYDKWQQKGSTLATGVSAAKAGELKKSNNDRNNKSNQNCLERIAKDFNQFKYYNC